MNNILTIVELSLFYLCVTNLSALIILFTLIREIPFAPFEVSITGVVLSSYITCEDGFIACL